ncbi:transporter substrate-binding domain-containing protein [Priestia flexa]
MKRKAGFFLTLLLSAVVLLAGCGQSSESASGSGDADTFTVGLEAGYPPFNWTQNDDSNGAVKIKGGSQYAGGYDVEMAKKIADGLGKELVIVKTEWDGLVPALTSGKIDSELKEEINKILKGISEEERTSIMDAAIKNQPAAK